MGSRWCWARLMMHTSTGCGSSIRTSRSSIRYQSSTTLRSGSRTAEGSGFLSAKNDERAKKIFTEYDIDIDVSKDLAGLNAASQTMTAIVRALHFGDAARGILVLDEPTASLSERDKDHLFSLLRAIKARGGTLLYVTHRLHEVFELADRVTVLRDGFKVATRDVDELNNDSLIELILGRPLDAFYPDPPIAGADSVLELKGLRGGALKDFTGTVKAGEIVGIVGLAGSGSEEIPHVIFGSRHRDAGEIHLMGEAIAPRSPWEGIRSGLAFVPGDRKRLGVIGNWTLRENVTLPSVRGRGPLRWLGRRQEAQDVTPYLTRCEVKPNDPEATISSLSGGNQQKIMIARWLRTGAKALLLEEPTAGVDVGSRSAIYKQLNEAARGGTAVLITTSGLGRGLRCVRSRIRHSWRSCGRHAQRGTVDAGQAAG